MQFKLSNPIRESFRVSDHDHTPRRTVPARPHGRVDGDGCELRAATANTQRRNVVP